MTKLSQEEIAKIIERLKERGVSLSCPRCRHASFTLLGGYFNQTIQNELNGMVLGGPSVPSVVTTCNKCGFLSQHALGTLGLLPIEEAKQ